MGLGLALSTFASSFVPEDISGLRVGYRADFGISAADIAGNAVGTWHPFGGSGDMVQAVGAHKPGYVANARNGQPGVTFSGAQWLASALAAATTGTVYAVLESTGDTSTYRCFLATLGLFCCAPMSGHAVWGIYQNANVLATHGVSSFSQVLALAAAPNDITLRTNGASDHVTTGVGSYTGGAVLWGMGSDSVGNNPFAGTICEIDFYDRILSAAEISALEAYGIARYAV